MNVPGSPMPLAALRPACHSDHVLDAGSTQRATQPRQAEPGVGNDRDRTGPPGGVEHCGQVSTGRDQQRHPVLWADADGGQTSSDVADCRGQLSPGDGALRAAASHLDDGDGVVMAAGIERRPEGAPLCGRGG